MRESMPEELRVVNSALWAAYGDALGFITELADEAAVKYRLGKHKALELSEWRRTIGGRYGVVATLPPGCYSDDTQLRLSTARAIRGDGYFDVEAFAKVELPVWLAYALGAGRGTKAGASNLARRDTNWFSNFYSTKGADYFECGGNGAAMRVQPHVWMRAGKTSWDALVGDVLRNAVSTHGHARGILGAVFHALTVRAALVDKRVPGPSEWGRIIRELRSVAALLREDSQLSTLWLPTWEDRTGRSVEEAFDEVCSELESAFSSIPSFEFRRDEDPAGWYQNVVQKFGGFDVETRGSGTGTACIASIVAWAFRHDKVLEAMQLAANTVGSDTDTVATMAGAVLGAVMEEAPPEPVLDVGYISWESRRLARIGMPSVQQSFQYPDLGTWTPPKSQVDAVGVLNGRMSVAGLGEVEPLGGPLTSRSRNGEVWQWVRFPFGQASLIKRREKLREATDLSVGRGYECRPSLEASKQEKLPFHDYQSKLDSHVHNKTLLSGREPIVERLEMAGKVTSHVIRSLHSLSQEAIRSGFDPEVIGEHLIYITDTKESIEEAVAYAAIVAKARLARNTHKKGE